MLNPMGGANTAHLFSTACRLRLALHRQLCQTPARTFYDCHVERVPIDNFRSLMRKPFLLAPCNKLIDGDTIALSEFTNDFVECVRQTNTDRTHNLEFFYTFTPSNRNFQVVLKHAVRVNFEHFLEILFAGCTCTGGQ